MENIHTCTVISLANTPGRLAGGCVKVVGGGGAYWGVIILTIYSCKSGRGRLHEGGLLGITVFL